MSRGHHKADKRLRSENPAAILGRKGGQASLKKYGKAQLKEWGKLGGRPKKKEPVDRRTCSCRGIPNQVCGQCQGPAGPDVKGESEA